MKIKKDADYFELLSKMVACTHEAARKLHELVVVYDQVPERCGEIHDIEHACDDLLHILLKTVSYTHLRRKGRLYRLPPAKLFSAGPPVL